MAEESRGSDKVLQQLFGEKTVTHQQLATAVEQARAGGYTVERWWWKGQPVVDWFKGVVRVRPEQFATTIGQLVGLHSNINQLSLEVFPKGVPKLEAIDVHITIDRNIQG